MGCGSPWGPTRRSTNSWAHSPPRAGVAAEDAGRSVSFPRLRRQRLLPKGRARLGMTCDLPPDTGPGSVLVAQNLDARLVRPGLRRRGGRRIMEGTRNESEPIA